MAVSPARATDAIDDLFTAYMLRENIPGAVLVVYSGDRPILHRAWGVGDRATGQPMDPEAIQPIYSISKQFTAALVLRLVESGSIDLDAAVGQYLPEWFADEPDLKVRQLLRHTSGLADFIAEPEALALEQEPPGSGSLAAIADLADRLPRRFAPAARHAYSNSNYTALALIVERVTGLSFAEAQRRLLLLPLGLGHIDQCAALSREAIGAGHDTDGQPYVLPPNPEPTFAGNGGLCASAQDLALWTRLLHQGGVVDAERLSEMLGTEMVTAGYTPPYGFGISLLPVAGRPAYSHSGGGEGWGAWAAYLPDDSLTMVLLANRGWLWSTDLGASLVRIVTKGPDPAPLQRSPVPPFERLALDGSFHDGLFEITIAAEDDRLILNNPPFGDPIDLWRQSDGRFVSPLRPDTFALRLVEGRPEFDWLEHRSYLVRTPPDADENSGRERCAASGN